MNSGSRAYSFGPIAAGPGRTRFRLWAPAQTSVLLEIEGAQPARMSARGGGWFEMEAACGPGARYTFRLQDGIVIPDPASRRQANDVHGGSVITDPDAYAWKMPAWRGLPWPEAVIYELHAGLLGGYRGVMGELSRLADLGITAIELMPIAEFPGARNWGYDGVLPFAPESSYGTPEDLKALVDAAHGHGLMIFLDVVYNHFGPDGNYLPHCAPPMFRSDVSTPWGPAIDFRRPEVRRFFIENALYWITEFRFDGLRFDAVHAITEADWLDEMAREVRAAVEPGRHVHLVLENDDNAANHLAGEFDAQWNDDGHHVLHVLLTGEHEGYYADYADKPAERLARCLAEGFAYQGEPSAYRDGKPRGTPSAHLPPSAFVLFLQNHDQIGNRAFGERLTALTDPAALEAAIALQLLCPQIPLLFMGEECASRSPFLFFTEHNEELANAVREGRRREFAGFGGFSDARRLAAIPDPNALATFENSKPIADSREGTARAHLYRRLLAIRRSEIMPRIPGSRALDAQALGPGAIVARWRMGDGSLLVIESNLAGEPADGPRPQARVLYASSEEAECLACAGRLAPHSTVAFLEPAT